MIDLVIAVENLEYYIFVDSRDVTMVVHANIVALNRWVYDRRTSVSLTLVEYSRDEDIAKRWEILPYADDSLEMVIHD